MWELATREKPISDKAYNRQLASQIYKGCSKMLYQLNEKMLGF